MAERTLNSLADHEMALQQPRLLLFKHSPVCPISAAARAEYDAWRQAETTAVTALVDVIEHRAVARGIAEHCGVRHESPQAILFVAGRPVWHASHHSITRAALAAAWGAH